MLKLKNKELCKQCGKLHYLSKRKLCTDCGIDNQREQQKQLKEKKGPYYEEWRKRLRQAR